MCPFGWMELNEGNKRCGKQIIHTSGFENKWSECHKILSEEALRKKHGDIVINN